MDDRFARLAVLKPVARRAKPAARLDDARPAGADRLAQILAGEIRRNHYGEYLAVRQWFAEPATAGAIATPAALRMLLPAKAEIPPALLVKIADPGNWLFLDTETTGLAGGTGTYAFLVGVAWSDAGGLEVEQFFMRDYAEEHSLLQALAERMAERRVLVTFNGKSFDWPLLETRFRMTRQIEPPEPLAHLDLLHPARQLWRLRLPSVRLAELERHVLGTDRGSDLWAQMIPQIYFDYLRGGPAEPLIDVFRHNQMDLRGLAALAGKIFSLLNAPDSAEEDPRDLYGLSRLLGRRGERPRARRAYERALNAGLPDNHDRAARRELAALAKRDRDFARAVPLWVELAGIPQKQNGEPAAGGLAATRCVEACEQLAIYYERQAREPQRAAEYVRVALAELRRASRAGLADAGQSARARERLEHRLARLLRGSTSLT